MNKPEMDSDEVLFPDSTATSRTAEEVILDLSISDKLAHFSGHFEQLAVLPGVTQIHWAVHFAKQFFSLPENFYQMEVIKFKQLILPSKQIKLALRYQAIDQAPADSTAGKLYFRYYNDQQSNDTQTAAEYSSGRLYFNALNPAKT